jgi:hypothetical protein
MVVAMLFTKNIFLVVLMALLSSCGGGGGSTGGGGGGGNLNAGVGAIGLKANFTNAAVITLTNSSTLSASTQVGLFNIKNKWIKGLIDLVIPTAYASTIPFNNILAFDSNGVAIPNPLVTDVNVFIGAITLDPTGTYVYLGIEDHQNSNMFADYRAINGSKCSLYRVNKNTGETICLANSSLYDLYNPSTNQQMLGNTSESFIKFDASGNGYLIMFAQRASYGSGGTEKQRLVKIDTNGNLSIVRDSSTGYARGLAYAKSGKIFYSEDAWLSIPGGVSSAFLFDPVNSTFQPLGINTSGNSIVSDIAGQVYISTGNSLYSLDQIGVRLSLIYQGGDPVNWLTRSQSGSVLVQHSSGNIYSLKADGRDLIASIGVTPLSRTKNDVSDLFYPPLATSGDYVVAKGTDLDGLGQFCAVRLSDKKSRCSKPSDSSPTYLSVAIVGAKGFIFYDSGTQNKMVSFDIANFIDGVLPDPAPTLSPAGDGSMIAAISMRPPITFVADLTNVTTATSDNMLTVSNPVSDTYTYLSFTSANSIAGIISTDLGLKNSSGSTVDAKFKIVDKVIYAAVTDTSGTKSSGFQTLGSTNDYSLVFPSSYTAPALTKGIGTKTGYFPVVQRSSIMYLDFSAPVVNLDLAALQLTDASGVSVPSTISMAKEGLRLEIRVKDSDAANLTGFKILPTGSVYKLTLPSRVRLPGQTFLSPFDRTQIVFTTTS